MHLPCFKWFDDNIKGSLQLALRTRDPSVLGRLEPDDSQYNVLRQGIMVIRDKDRNGLSCTSTSDVLVQNGSGDRYLTVAAHIFPKGGEAHHLQNNGRSIGTVYHSCANQSDLALFKLNDKETFVNQLFETAEDNDRCKLAALTSCMDLRQCDVVHKQSVHG